MTAISATIFLISINWTLVTVRILENMTELSLGPAAAFSVFVVVVVYVVLWIIGKAARAFPHGRGRARGKHSGRLMACQMPQRRPQQRSRSAHPVPIRLDAVSKGSSCREGRDLRGEGCVDQCAAGRTAHAAGPVRLRQDDDAAHDCRL